MRLIVSLLTAFATLAFLAHPLSAADAEPAILTLAGKMTNPNRGPLDEFRDAYLMHKDKKFTEAHAFTRSGLAALPQTKTAARAEGWPVMVELKGPRLSDALKAAGVAEDATIVATALDGYTVELTPDIRAAHEWILAIEADGAPIATGGRGPVWLIHGTDGKTVGPDIEATWVWALYVLEVK